MGTRLFGSGGNFQQMVANPLGHAYNVFQGNASFDPLGLSGNSSKKPDPPTPPDYVGAAREQGQQNIELANTMARLNNPNINNPLGSQNVTWEDGRATVNQTLNPGTQAILDSQLRVGGQMGNLAEQGLGRVGQTMGQPFTHGGPSQVQSLQGSPIQNTIGSAGQIQSGIGHSGPIQNTIGGTGNVQSGLNMASAPQLPTGIANVGDAQRGLDLSGVQSLPGQVPGAGQNITQSLHLGGAPALPGQIDDVGSNQRSLSFSGLPSMPGAGDFSSERDRIEDALLSRMERRFGRDEDALRTQMAVQGLGPTTEAARREFERLDESRTDARMQAILASGTEQSRLFGLGMGARQQAVSEQTAAANFANQAQQQAFQQAALRGDFGLDVRQQAVQEALSGGMFENQAQQQAFQQQLMNNQFGLNVHQQGMQNALNTGTFSNQAQQQEFQQALARGDFGMDARQQAYAEALGGGQFANQAQQQSFAQALQGGQFTNTAQQQAFLQAMQGGQFNNTAQQQAFAQALQSGQFSNAAQQQAYAQALTSGNFQNQARQQAIQEAAFNRSLPLNELNALRSGAQTQMPTFQNFTGANAQPAPHMNAVMAQGQHATDLYNAQVQQQAGMQNGLFQLGGTAAMLFAMSDRRLKENVVRVGTHPLGIGVYEYDIFGERQRGVMADEVLTVKPEAVGEIAGYLTVDYGRLDA